MQVFLVPFSVPLAVTAWIYDSSNVSKALNNKAVDLNRFSLGDDIAVRKYKTMEKMSGMMKDFKGGGV